LKTIFDHISAITEQQPIDYLSTLSDKEYKEFNVFLICKFLALNNNLTEFISYIDKYVFRMSKEHFYKFLTNIIPKKKYWITINKKEKIVKEHPEMLDKIQRYFVFISKREAEFYASLMTTEQKVSILRKFGVQNKEIDKILNGD